MSREEKKTAGVIAEYLGEDAAAGGPFALLGLRHEPIDQGMILRACQVRLGRINGHRRAQTPGADEVRLAVHTAASQLLDPELRAELAKHWPEGVGEIGLVGESPEAWRVEPTSRLDDRLRQQALTLLGACGGWNARSRKRLGQFARMHQVSAAQLVAGILGEQGGEDDGRSDTADRVVRGPSLIDPAAGALPWALIPVAYVMMGLVLISAGYVKGLGDGVAELRTVEIGNAGVVETKLDTRGRGKVQVSERRHHSAILFELEKMQREGVLDLERAEEFSAVGQRLGEQWTEFPAEELDRAVDAVRGVLGGILNAETFVAASKFLRVDADGTTDSMLMPALRSWLFGSADRDPEYSVLLSRGEEIGNPGTLDGHLGAVFGQRTRQGVDDPAWWSWWIEQLGPMEARSEGFVDSGILEAAFLRLIAQPMGDQWDACARQIVQRVSWGEGSAARSWMMGVIVDPKVRSDRLAVLTKAIVIYSSAKGLGVDMVVYPGDSISDRQAYLGRLREQWATDAGVVDDIRAQLIDRIELLLRMTRNPMGDRQAMTRGVGLARVNGACIALHDDDEAMMLRLIGSFDSPMETGAVAGFVLNLSSSAADEQWATDARNLDDAEALFGHLEALGRVASIGPKSAHALVYMAMQAPDLQVRAQAERSMLARRDDAAILIALDRVAGANRTTRRMVELINSYVGREGDLGDARGSRKALLERLVLIGVLEENVNDGGVGDFARTMNELFGQRSGSQSDAGVKGYFDGVVIERMVDGRSVPESVRAGLMVRLRIAQGPMQRFAAYQSAALELFADEISSEHPGLRSRVDRVMDDSNGLQRAAKSAIEQILLIERAMAELWLIVLESGVVS